MTDRDPKPAPAPAGPHPKSKLAQAEEETLRFWKESDVFGKSLEKPSPKCEFVFYEGPPTANGRPGIHHMEARAFKDAIPRFKTMQGYHVRRKGGWDTHGLPVELEVEKLHGFKSKKDIEAYGIARFNEECKENVWKYVDEWNKFTERIGYWVDEKDPYITYKSSYIESVWSIVRHVAESDLLYKDYRVVPWCPRCGTALSSHELAQGYADVKDLSVYADFKVVGEPHLQFLAWTTTPWTLPGNVGLAVGADIDYVYVESAGETYILAVDRVASVFAGKDHALGKTVKGKELVGMAYEPLYPFLRDNISGSEREKLKNAYRVYAADFVTTTDGTGIVHTAVMYGQDDFDLGTAVGLPKYHLVNDDGTFKPEAGFLAGAFVKDEGTEVAIIKDLAHRGLLFGKEKYAHSYPHCWRCKTPLIYFARDSWYIRMSDLRKKLIKENEKVSWEPEHIKEGRFGEWLREVKDWAISRERYWGTPLPVWQSEEGEERLVIGSIDELKRHIKRSGNSYLLLRHGECEANVRGVSNSEKLDAYGLTEKGKAEIETRAKEIAKLGVDVIVASDFLRTKETARMVARAVGIPENQVVYDERLREFDVGPEREGRSWRETEREVRNGKTFAGMETPAEVKKRSLAALYDIDGRYQGKRVLIVAHGAILNFMFHGAEAEATIDMMFHDSRRHFQHTGELREADFAPLPHNDDYDLDLHRPYIDGVVLVGEAGRELRRVKEVMDVWLDSGAMPFAEDHYPFENKKYIDKVGYPADFISEAIDQTRGWFYTLLAVGVLMGKGAAYKNVICLGHILDKDGKKMSKSVGNVVNPWEMIDKYGADAIRLWMYSVNQPGDSKNFDERSVDEIVKRVFNLLSNVCSFYELYADRESVAEKPVEAPKKPANVLDLWILSRLSELTSLVTDKLESYKLLEPVRAIREFIDDLSTWYLRRSRDRFKAEGSPEALADKAAALATTRYVLAVTAKLLAPFAPFYAEHLYGRVKSRYDAQSVHLEAWPTTGKADAKAVSAMAETRRLVTLALQERAKAGIKVRQPLSRLAIKSKLGLEYVALIQDEVNVKEVSVDPSQAADTALDAEVTPELRREGVARDLIRAIQDLRKADNLTVGDKVALELDSDEKGKELVREFIHEIKRVTLVTDVSYARLPHREELKFEEFAFRIALRR